MNFQKEFRKIFSGEPMSKTEQDVLLDEMRSMADDVKLKLDKDVIEAWALKITGIIGFLFSCGKISLEQDEDLHVAERD